MVQNASETWLHPQSNEEASALSWLHHPSVIPHHQSTSISQMSTMYQLETRTSGHSQRMFMHIHIHHGGKKEWGNSTVLKRITMWWIQRTVDRRRWHGHGRWSRYWRTLMYFSGTAFWRRQCHRVCQTTKSRQSKQIHASVRPVFISLYFPLENCIKMRSEKLAEYHPMSRNGIMTDHRPSPFEKRCYATVIRIMVITLDVQIKCAFHIGSANLSATRSLI